MLYTSPLDRSSLADPLRLRARLAGIASRLVSDGRLAIRSLLRERRFAALAVFTLSIGIGTAVAIFAILNQMFIRPPVGIGNTKRLGYLRFEDRRRPSSASGAAISTAVFDALRAHAPSLEGLGSYAMVEVTASIDHIRPFRLHGEGVYGDYFQLLGVRAIAGHLPSATELRARAGPYEVVVSHKVALQLFGSPTRALGQPLRLNGHSFVIAAVTSGNFAGPDPTQPAALWVPYGALPFLTDVPTGTRDSTYRLTHDAFVVRWRNDASAESIEAELAAVVKRLTQVRPGENVALAHVEPRVFPGLAVPPQLRSMVRRVARILIAVAVLVVLIACANTTSVLLVRNSRRSTILAVQRALGASSAAILREHVVLSCALSLASTVIGFAASTLLVLPFGGAKLEYMPPIDGRILDFRVACVGVLICVAVSVLVGGLPALVAARLDPADVLRRSYPRRKSSRPDLGSATASGQLALCLMLLVGSFLLTETARNQSRIDLGIDIHDVSTLTLHYAQSSVTRSPSTLYRKILASVDTIPGIAAAAIAPDAFPSSMILGRAAASDGATAQPAAMIPVTPDWFRVFRITPLSGRTFRESDWSPHAPARVILTASLAKRLLGREDAAGRYILAGFGTPQPVEVIGVTRNMRTPYNPDQALDAFFVPYSFAESLPFNWLAIVVRGGPNDPHVVNRVQSAISTILPDAAVPDLEPLSQRVSQLRSQTAVLTRLLTLASIIALALAAIGMYGVVGVSVARRRREFGIRIALGARTHNIVGLVTGHATTILLTGALAGAGGAYALGGLLRSQLFGVGPTDAGSYGRAALVLGAATVLACWIPARRAARVDPMSVIRES